MPDIKIPFLIGLHGKAGAGKDTFATFAGWKFKYDIASFATPLKAGVAAMFGVPVDKLLSHKTKDDRDEFWNLTYRQMLQFTGTEAMRNTFGNDFWIRRLIYTINGKENPCFITDVRFQNEVDFVKQHGVIVHIIRKDNPYAKAAAGHSSEADVTLSGGSGKVYEISNSDSILHFKEQILNLMNSIITEHRLIRHA